MQSRWSFLRRWEGLLLILLIVIVVYNALNTPGYLTVNNWVNLFQLSIEKIIVALIMTFIIINAEIDLSVASVMGLSACLTGFLYAGGMAMEGALVMPGCWRAWRGCSTASGSALSGCRRWSSRWPG
jgi:rhamnose transport system permease protein